MMPARQLKHHAPLFAALGDETRLRLVAKLCDRSPQSISELTTGTRITRQAVTKHLRVLEGAGLVRSVPKGRENLYQLEPEPFVEIRDYVEAVSRRWDRTLARLQSFVET